MSHVFAAILGAFVGYALAARSSDGDRKPPVNPEWVVPITPNLSAADIRALYERLPIGAGVLFCSAIAHDEGWVP